MAKQASLVDDYRKNRPLYERFTEEMRVLVEKCLKDVDKSFLTVLSRTKSLKSFEKRITEYPNK